MGLHHLRSGLAVAAPTPDETISLKFEKDSGGRGGYNRWTINGKSWPDTNPLFTVTEGKRYRLLLNNNSGDEHPVHLHRHSFEITKIGDKPTSGVIKDTLQHAALLDGRGRLRGGRSWADLVSLSPSGPHGRRLRGTDRVCMIAVAEAQRDATALHRNSFNGCEIWLCAVEQHRQQALAQIG